MGQGESMNGREQPEVMSPSAWIDRFIKEWHTGVGGHPIGGDERVEIFTFIARNIVRDVPLGIKIDDAEARTLKAYIEATGNAISALLERRERGKSLGALDFVFTHNQTLQETLSAYLRQKNQKK